MFLVSIALFRFGPKKSIVHVGMTDSHFPFVLFLIIQFDGIGYKAGDHTMENHEVWSDGSRIFISRGPLFDSLVSFK